ncbi:FapA family protein [Vibrio sp. Of7-15]|uniref:DUF342 domain-containing protein n=1 Tax=Vibrio sp. Of7-15 TaxID=2724879 RepID=UPI001EF212DC|nr:FapA family protein [Vibrio sp. Of7-15]MCG7497951.1 FapA family protein [Vibrio sp. Of7-15]
MWQSLIKLSEDSQQVITQLPEQFQLESELTLVDLDVALEEIGAKDFLVDKEAVSSFVTELKGSLSCESRVIAERKDASFRIDVDEDEMQATMTVTGAYGGGPLQGNLMIAALAKQKIAKGIIKVGLQRVLAASKKLAPGEEFSHLVAKGVLPKHGADAQFHPLVEDFREQVLQPQEIEGDDQGRVDMRNLGETITVNEGDKLMKRTPATRGKHGFTVLGNVLEAEPGRNTKLKAGKGAKVAEDDPNLLVATLSGMPWIHEHGAEVDNTLCLNTIDITTGHIKFKGSVVVSGDVTPGMMVRATGSVTVGGFIESANVQAHGDVVAMKGIIGHQVEKGEEYSCFVKAAGSITSKFTQYADVQASKDINLGLHAMHSLVRSGKSVTVMDSAERNGTICGGEVFAAENITTVNLGATAGTETLVNAFTRYGKYKESIEKLQEAYKAAQDDTMKVVRAELDLSKVPKAERTQEMTDNIQQMKAKNAEELSSTKNRLELREQEFNDLLKDNAIIAKNHVFPRVTLQFGDDQVVTKRDHGPCRISFNQYEIKLTPIMGTKKEMVESE